MAAKSLNKKNLLTLGADALADLLLEAVKGDAARQRRVRLALSAEQSPRELAADVRKRFAAIRRARSYLSWKSQRTLARELSDLIGLIDTRIANRDADLAFDLLWQLLQLAPGIQERTDDSNGTIGGVMDSAMEAIAGLAVRLETDPVALADTVFEALLDNDYGEYDHAVTALGDALGDAGLAHLKTRAEALIAAPLSDADLERYPYISDPARLAELARDSRDRTARMILQDVADLQGDVDAWMSRYTAEQLTFHTIAPDAAQRLLGAGRAEEALQVMENCMAKEDARDRWFDARAVDDTHFLCLEALGREEELRAALWARFETRMCAPTLRAYLKRLPDFEDEEAWIRAQDKVLAFDDIARSLAFCLAWPDPRLCAQVVLRRGDELDGNAYEILTPAADMLAPEQPLAAVLIWRAMILYALDKARASRYRHAARHLASCLEADAAITDYAGHPDHGTFVQALRADHGRKSGFWRRVP